MFPPSRSLASKLLSPSGLLMKHCILPPKICAFGSPIQNKLPNSSNFKSSHVKTFRPVVMKPFRIRSNLGRSHFSTTTANEDKKGESIKENIKENIKGEGTKKSKKYEGLLLSNDIDSYIDRTISHQLETESYDFKTRDPHYWSSFTKNIIDENPLLGYDPWVQYELEKLKVYEKLHEVELQKYLFTGDISYICLALPTCVFIFGFFNDVAVTFIETFLFVPLFGFMSLSMYRFRLLIVGRHH